MVKPASAQERKLREKPPLSPTDGRVLRGKGRNVALNFRVTAEFKQRFYDVAKARNMTMTDVLELAQAGELGLDGRDGSGLAAAFAPPTRRSRPSSVRPSLSAPTAPAWRG